MQVIYRPVVQDVVTGSVGWFIDDEIVTLKPNVVSEVPDRIWAKLERWPSVADMIADGQLEVA